MASVKPLAAAVAAASAVAAHKKAFRDDDVPPGQTPWTPESLAGLIDYGIWTDNSRLKQDEAGTTAVTAAGQRIGYWRGQKDVLAFVAEGGTSYRPVLAADGIHFDAPARRLAAVTSMSLNNNSTALTLAASENTQASGNAQGLQFLAQVDLASSTRVGFDLAAAYAGILLQPSGYEMATSVGNVSGARQIIASLPAGNSSRAMTGWVNGTKYTSGNAVVSGSTFTRLVMKTASVFYGNTKAK